MLFTGEQGHPYGYRDEWTDGGIFLYSGEGQVGGMQFVRGNRKVRDHVRESRDLHLFEYVRRGRVRYIDQMVCTGWHTRAAPDLHGNSREIIVFELTPASAFAAEQEGPQLEGDVWAQSLSALRKRAVASSDVGRDPVERKQLMRYRSAAVRAYVLKRARGICEACGEDAPFRTSEGRPYLEPHHLMRLSDGGPDDPARVAALCPNCHRRAHYGADSNEFNAQIKSAVAAKELAYG